MSVIKIYQQNNAMLEFMLKGDSIRKNARKTERKAEEREKSRSGRRMLSFLLSNFNFHTMTSFHIVLL